MSIAAVIPTRNRARYAINAARSLLDQDSRIDIYISDNSSSAGSLSEYCRDERRITYLRPACELPMGEHWDWAVRQAMERSTATHFTVHYDRRHSKAGSWDRLDALASRRSGSLISFPMDQITSQPPPLRLWQTPWTGKAFSVESARVAAMIASGRIAQAGQALPVLSNCLVPRAVLQSIIDRFGDVCNSAAPDSAFGARFLALHDAFIYHDRAQGIVYASHRSTGMGYLRGKGGDFRDFMNLSGEGPWLDAAPIPGMSLGYNMFYHEFELVRRTADGRLPRLDRAAILQDLAGELRWIASRRLRRRMRSALAEQGWSGPEPARLPRRGWRDALHETVLRRRMASRGEIPQSISGFTFSNDEQALRYALRYPRLRQETHEHLESLGVTEIAS